jgi:hypothetical protein
VLLATPPVRLAIERSRGGDAHLVMILSAILSAHEGDMLGTAMQVTQMGARLSTRNHNACNNSSHKVPVPDCGPSGGSSRSPAERIGFRPVSSPDEACQLLNGLHPLSRCCGLRATVKRRSVHGRPPGLVRIPRSIVWIRSPRALDRLARTRRDSEQNSLSEVCGVFAAPPTHVS